MKEVTFRFVGKLLFVFLVIVTGGLLGFRVASAEYPEQPVTLIVPFPAGGVTDIGARAFADALEKHFKKPVVVVNKVGGATTIGGNSLATAKPDGYTLGYFPSMASMPEVYSYFIQAPYASKALQPVCRVAEVVGTICVKGDSPLNTFNELVEYMRKHPGTTWGVHSRSTLGYIILRQIAKRENVNITDVILEGDVKIIPAVLGGHIMVGTPVYTPVKPLLDAKQIKLLALLTEKRADFLPKQALITEFGYKIPGGLFNAVFAPKSTPPDIVKKLSDAAATICRNPSFQSKFVALGMLPNYENAETLAVSFERERTNLLRFFEQEGLTKK
jgi:tripartite-type tricarboxylate transporter receptor subunit TctC